MENKTRICSECNTQNEEKYEYCKNCGNQLSAVDNNYTLNTEQSESAQQYNNSYNTNYEQNQDYNNQNSSTCFQKPYYGNAPIFTGVIDELPYGDYAIFVGKKGDKYMPAFSKLEISSSKASWHWPTAILGFLFGPLGAAIWFFYRKIYKTAIVLTLIGALVLVVNGIFFAPMAKEFINSLDTSNITAAITSEEFFEQIEKISNENNVFIEIINDTSSLITAIVCGIFAHHIYKKHIHNSILKYRSLNRDPRYYQMALSALGGTSSGMAVLGVIIMTLLQNIPTVMALIYGLLF